MMANWRLVRNIGIITALLLGGYVWLSNHKSFGFSVGKITSSFPADPTFETPLISANLKYALFSQDYRYLSSGAQLYAFVSEDGKYVIKFFRVKKIEDAQKRKSLFSAYKLAYEELRKESGLLMLHLNKTTDLSTKLRVRDKLGFSHTIDLDQTEFVVQEKAELIFDYLKKLPSKDQVDQAIGAILDLVRHRIEKGITDQDKAVSHNYGFVDGRPIHLDIGRIYKGTTANEYTRIQTRITSWQKNQN